MVELAGMPVPVIALPTITPANPATFVNMLLAVVVFAVVPYAPCKSLPTAESAPL